MNIVLFTLLAICACYAAIVTLLLKKAVNAGLEKHERLNVINNTIEYALDELDDRYKTIVRIASTPVLYDSPEIRMVCKALIDARDTVAIVSKQITNVVEEENENKTNDVE